MNAEWKLSIDRAEQRSGPRAGLEKRTAAEATLIVSCLIVIVFFTFPFVLPRSIRPHAVHSLRRKQKGRDPEARHCAFPRTAALQSIRSLDPKVSSDRALDCLQRKWRANSTKTQNIEKGQLG